MVEPTAPSSPQFVVLPRRGVLGIGGKDARELLQNVVSNDVRRLSRDAALYALLLTPQGKYLHDFFLVEHNDAASGATLLLDAERERIPDLLRRLTLYKLRADVTLADISDRVSVAAVFGDAASTRLGLKPDAGSAAAFDHGVAFVDPRVAGLGARVIAPRVSIADSLAAAGLHPSSERHYDAVRLRLGIPDSSRDLLIDKTFPLEAGLDTLHAIDYGKGCYVGQELTARTHYRGTIRKRFIPVRIEGPAPAAGTPVMAGNIEAGEMRSAVDGIGIALLRLDHVRAAEQGGPALTAGDATLRAALPAWLELPPAESGSANS